MNEDVQRIIENSAAEAAEYVEMQPTHLGKVIFIARLLATKLAAAEEEIKFLRSAYATRK